VSNNCPQGRQPVPIRTTPIAQAVTFVCLPQTYTAGRSELGRKSRTWCSKPANCVTVNYRASTVVRNIGSTVAVTNLTQFQLSGRGYLTVHANQHHNWVCGAATGLTL